MVMRQPSHRGVLMTTEAQRLRFAADVAEYLENVGRRIRERREELGLSRDEVSRRMGGKTNGNAIYRWENAKHQAEPEALERLAEVLGVTVAYFYSDGPSQAVNGEPPDDDRLARVEAKLDELLALVKQRVDPVGLGVLGDLGAQEPQSPAAQEHAGTRARHRRAS